MYTSPSATFSDSKPHYNILDGLRGVAAITVVWYHIFEAFATSHFDQIINHGYLAVDFFFILSGFVIGYAYDGRWQKMSLTEFFKRRLIRLHPMVIMGAIIGAIMFYTQGCEAWDVSVVSVGALLFATVLSALLIPSLPTTEVRGIGEMYPLNGPAWSLFFEYIGYVLYAFIIRRLPTFALSILVILAGFGLAIFAITGETGHLGVGWTMDSYNMLGGSLRLLFSFSAGLLLSRVFKPCRIKGSFWIGTFAIILVAVLPNMGNENTSYINGIYDSICILLVFPLLVYLGASEQATSPTMSRVCKFLGDISYPLYMVHYPFIYLYYAWVKNENLTFAQSLPGALAVVIGSIILAYFCLKLYDEPVRKYLTTKFLKLNKKG